MNSISSKDKERILFSRILSFYYSYQYLTLAALKDMNLLLIFYCVYIMSNHLR